MPGFVIPTVDEVMNSRRENLNYSEFSFPDDLGPHAIILNFSDYNFDTTANTVASVISSSICLPIPANLTDTFSLKVTGNELGPIGDITRTLVGIGKDAPDTATGFQKVMESDQLSWSAASRAIKSALASSDSSIVKGAEVAFGAIINPHIALTFDGIDLKTHNFEWTFAPTSSSESVKLSKIVRLIKQSILPSYRKDAARTFLQYPKVVDVFFTGTEPGHMYFFKRCMVSSFETNYAPNGVPAFLPGGRPAFVQMKIALTEMEIHTTDDYAGE